MFLEELLEGVIYLKAASGDEPGAALLISVFFIKLCFVSIGAE
jgi:hypothetical protein